MGWGQDNQDPNRHDPNADTEIDPDKNKQKKMLAWAQTDTSAFLEEEEAKEVEDTSAPLAEEKDIKIGEEILEDPLPPPQTENLPQLPKGYRYVQDIGKGSQGEVWRVLNQKLDRYEAVKILYNYPHVEKRFHSEIKSIARLNHPHIVTIHFAHEEKLCFSMEYLGRGTFSQVLHKNDFSGLERGFEDPKEFFLFCLHVVKDVALGLHYAHEKGIIHRDLKPQNILFSSERRPKITDFGLVKGIDRSSITFTPIGTPAYMAPEQWETPKEVDHRCDIWSLGIMLYEIAAHQHPFPGLPSHLKEAIIDEPIINYQGGQTEMPEWEKALVPIYMKALEKKRNNRYQSAQEIAHELENIIERFSPNAPREEIFYPKDSLVIAIPKQAARKVSMVLIILFLLFISTWFGMYLTTPSNTLSEKKIEIKKKSPIEFVFMSNFPVPNTVLKPQEISLNGKDASSMNSFFPDEYQLQVQVKGYQALSEKITLPPGDQVFILKRYLKPVFQEAPQATIAFQSLKSSSGFTALNQKVDKQNWGNKQFLKFLGKNSKNIVIQNTEGEYLGKIKAIKSRYWLYKSQIWEKEEDILFAEVDVAFALFHKKEKKLLINKVSSGYALGSRKLYQENPLGLFTKAFLESIYRISREIDFLFPLEGQIYEVYSDKKVLINLGQKRGVSLNDIFLLEEDQGSQTELRVISVSKEHCKAQRIKNSRKLLLGRKVRRQEKTTGLLPTETVRKNLLADVFVKPYAYVEEVLFLQGQPAPAIFSILQRPRAKDTWQYTDTLYSGWNYKIQLEVFQKSYLHGFQVTSDKNTLPTFPRPASWVPGGYKFINPPEPGTYDIPPGKKMAFRLGNKEGKEHFGFLFSEKPIAQPETLFSQYLEGKQTAIPAIIKIIKHSSK